MHYMQLIAAKDIDHAREAYLRMLAVKGASLPPTTQIFVERVQKAANFAYGDPDWLCYLAVPGVRAA